MVQYIRKYTLVNEIEARIQKLLPMVGFATTLKGASMQAASEELKHILSFINTIEVKEADLKKELDYGDYMNFFKEHPEYDNEDWGFEETWTFGQYCYKLGLKAK